MLGDEQTRRRLGERTGKHFCVKCLAEVPADVYLRNDHICDDCTREDEYPLKSTPSTPSTPDPSSEKP